MSSANDVKRVLTIMEMGAPGPGAPDGGMSPGADTGDVGNMMAGMMDTMGVTPEEEQYDDNFNDAEMKLAKRFIEIVGCPDRAAELLDKAIEGLDYLGMVNDNEDGEDSNAIDAMAQAMPTDADAPTTIAHMVSSFDPNAG